MEEQILRFGQIISLSPFEDWSYFLCADGFVNSNVKLNRIA